MDERAKKVLTHLRSLYEDEGPEWLSSTEDLAEDLQMDSADLYDHDRDSGALFSLMREGLVMRFQGEQRGEWKWVAAGARIEWD